MLKPTLLATGFTMPVYAPEVASAPSTKLSRSKYVKVYCGVRKKSFLRVIFIHHFSLSIYGRLRYAVMFP